MAVGTDAVLPGGESTREDLLTLEQPLMRLPVDELRARLKAQQRICERDFAYCTAQLDAGVRICENGHARSIVDDERARQARKNAHARLQQLHKRLAALQAQDDATVSILQQRTQHLEVAVDPSTSAEAFGQWCAKRTNRFVADYMVRTDAKATAKELARHEHIEVSAPVSPLTPAVRGPRRVCADGERRADADVRCIIVYGADMLGGTRMVLRKQDGAAEDEVDAGVRAASARVHRDDADTDAKGSGERDRVCTKALCAVAQRREHRHRVRRRHRAPRAVPSRTWTPRMWAGLCPLQRLVLARSLGHAPHQLPAECAARIRPTAGAAAAHRAQRGALELEVDVVLRTGRTGACAMREC